jgi:hypothetical protein
VRILDYTHTIDGVESGEFATLKLIFLKAGRCANFVCDEPGSKKKGKAV